MHVLIMSTIKYTRFKKDPLKTVGGVDYTIYTIKCDERTDRRTDGQGRIFKSLDCRYGT